MFVVCAFMSRHSRQQLAGIHLAFPALAIMKLGRSRKRWIPAKNYEDDRQRTMTATDYLQKFI